MDDQSSALLGGTAKGASAGASFGPYGALIGAGIGFGASLYQYNKNKKNIEDDAANRPQYQIPDEIRQNLTQEQQQALLGIPEEQKQQYISNLQRSAAYGLNQLGTRKAGITGVATANQNLNEGYSNLRSADAAQRNENLKGLMAARQSVADYKDQGFQLNQLNPYYEKIAARNANEGALTKSIQNAGQLSAYIGNNGASQPANIPQNPYGFSANNNMNNYNPYNNPQGIVPGGNFQGGNTGYMNQQNYNTQNPNFNPSEYA